MSKDDRDPRFYTSIALDTLSLMKAELWKIYNKNLYNKNPNSLEFTWNSAELHDPEYREALRKEWKKVYGADKELYFAKKSGYGGVGKISVISIEPGVYNTKEGQVISFEDLEE